MALPVGEAREYAKSDSSTDSFNWVMMATAGTLVIETTKGTNTITSGQAGVWIPIGNAIRITTASTATGLVVF